MVKDILVLTPTLGNRDSLTKTINSVKDIGKDRIFHVIIAPNSKVFEIQNAFPWVEVICEPNNSKSIYEVLNYAFKKYLNIYNYFTYINDDDYWTIDFSYLIYYLDTNPFVDVVYGKVKYINSVNKIIGEQTCSPRYKSFPILFSQDIILFTQQATLMRSKVFYELGGFDENYKLISDTLFWYQAIKCNYIFYYLNKFCAFYMIQDGQLSADKNLQKKEHEMFKKLIISNNYIATYETILFRLFNLKIYIKRFFLRFYIYKPNN
jgi:hypothetical protein